MVGSGRWIVDGGRWTVDDGWWTLNNEWRVEKDELFATEHTTAAQPVNRVTSMRDKNHHRLRAH